MTFDPIRPFDLDFWKKLTPQAQPLGHSTYTYQVWYRSKKKLFSKMTFDPIDPLTLTFGKNEPLKGNRGVILHVPTKFGTDQIKHLGGVGEPTNKQIKTRRP